MSGERQAIVIVGGGIGGLTAALTLAGVGFRIIVAERYDHLNESGAGIQLSPNATRILAGLGLETAIAAQAIEPACIEVRSGLSGRTVTSVPSAAYRARYGAPYRVIHRAGLQAILAEAVAAHPAIDLELGATVAQYLPRADSYLVRVQKQNGIDVVPAVALIAADGVWSTFRERIPGSATPAPTGRTAWRALVPADVARDLVAMDRVGLWLGPDAHLVHYPVTKGSAVNIVAIVSEDWQKKGWSAPGDRAELARNFRTWPAEARRLLSSAVSWQKFALVTIDPAKPWTHERLALLGDAAHAMVPFLAQGAAMAIEDAAVLASSLQLAPDIPAALRAYEAARRERVTAVGDASLKTGARYHWSGPMAFARDTALRFAGERLILDSSDWIYRWQPPATATA